MAVLMACTSRQHSFDHILAEADSIMEQDADSAYHLLQSIADMATQSDEANRAYFTLLLTQASYKLYQPVPADSLILPAVRYYEQAANPSLLCRAYYYQAMTRYEQGHHDEALLILKKGEQLATEIRDTLQLSKYHESLCMVNGKAKYHELMLKYALLAIDDATQMQDTPTIVRNLSNAATACDRLGRKAESQDYIMKTLPLIHAMNSKSKAYILTNIGCQFHSDGNNEKAKEFLLLSLQSNPMPNTYAELGDVFAEEGNMAEAEKCWQKALDNNNPQTTINVLSSMMYQYEHQNDYQKAYRLFERIYELDDSLRQTNEQATIAEIQHKYDKQVVESRYYKTIAWGIGAAFLTFILIVVFLYYHYQTVKGYTSKLAENRMMIQNAQQQIALLEDSGEEHVKEIATLKKSIADLRRTDFEEIGHGKQVYNAVAAGQPIRYRDDENSLIEYYSIFHYDIFHQWMREYKNLTARPITYLILVDMGKTDSEIQQLLGVSYNAIRTLKSRLRTKKSE